MSILSVVKTQLANEYPEMGHLPNSNRDAYLGEPESYASQALKALRIIDDGVIVMEFNLLSGVEDGLIFWVPAVHGLSIDWHCETPSYSNIQQFIPQCRYVDVSQ